MAKLNVGIVGLGRIGWDQHCLTLNTHKQYNLVATCDPVVERGQEAESTLGVVAYTDYSEFLKHAGLDVVVIASPTHLHKEQSVLAMKHGMHVMLEKPMAVNIAEARSIVRASEKYQRTLTVYQPHRFSPSRAIVEKLLKRRDLGRPYQISMNWHRYVRRNDWQAMIKFGGGMLGNYGAHTLDFMLSLTGYDIDQLFAHMDRIASLGDAEDLVSIKYRTRQGMIGEINVNQGSLAQPPLLEMYFTKGYVSSDGRDFTVTSIKGKLAPKKLITDLASAGRKYPRDHIPTQVEIIKSTDEMSTDFYKNFAQAVHKGKPLTVPPEHTLEVMRMMQRIRKLAGF